MALEFKIISDTSKKSFEESLSIMCNNRDYVIISELTTTSVVMFNEKEGCNEIVTTYSILIKRTV